MNRERGRGARSREHGGEEFAILGSKFQCVSQQVQGAQAVIDVPRRFQAANGADTHPGPFRDLFLCQSRLVS
ncbi:hypothetical protein Sar04_42250 [Salinispora arenicola]|uniref:Uncharacterized protein n=1 Tax=Salinispora arenicola TaxID=168697 RepID=A0ABQ4JZY9_SALAC|nr:hypothetical protein Sar04_42250 [Salinispora arenicola]